MTAAGPKLEKADLQPAEPTLDVHTFSDKIVEATMHFQVLRLSDSFFLWIGSSPQFNNLAMAMVTRFVSVQFVTVANVMILLFSWWNA